MNLKIIFCFLNILILSSCIRNEALNSEADIEKCIVISPQNTVRSQRIGNKDITFFIRSGADLGALELEFELTPGARLEKEQRFYNLYENPVVTVISEDGQWKKEYHFVATETTVPKKLDFEHVELYNDRFYRFYELSDNGRTKLYLWDSGNEGYAIVAGKQGPDDYPTCYSEEGKNGKCAKMVTRDTKLGSLVGMPIAAGNLFLGSFNQSAIKIGNCEASLKSTEFGCDIDFVPESIRGYYKYKAGENFLDENGKVVPEQKDEFDIYAMLYEPTDDIPFVDGKNQFTSPALVALARLDPEDRVETDEWKEFHLFFKLLEGKKIDVHKLNEGKYRMSLIFTSSINGDHFIGAVGSTLMVDEIEIIPEK